MIRTLLLTLCSVTPLAAQAGDSLVLVSPESRVVLHAADFARLPRDTARAQFHEQPAEEYSGVPLPALLQLVGIRSDSLRGRSLALRVVLEAADGYRVVLALTDLDPPLGGRRVILADRVAGQPLPPKEAPFRLLIPGDQRPSRWARQIVAVYVLAEPT